jgi:hypothetical protein
MTFFALQLCVVFVFFSLSTLSCTEGNKEIKLSGIVKVYPALFFPHIFIRSP